MGRTRTINREAVLQAAAAVAAEDGPGSITLESVAARAGISKGGLQYLYRSKQELLRALIEHYVGRLDEAVRQAYDSLPEGPGRGLKAYVLGNLGGVVQRDPVTAALLAAVIHEPTLLAPSQAEYRKNLNAVAEQGTDLPLAMIVMCAVDGLLFSEFLQVAPHTAAERRRLIDRLLQLAETGSALPAPTPLPSPRRKRAGA